MRAAFNLVPQVQVPPRGIWGATGQARTVTTASWTGRAVPKVGRPADVLGRFLAPPGELQVGVVLALIGAPFFVHIVRRRRLLAL